MGRSISQCFYCNDMWDDAHWYFRGDDGGIQYPGGMCEREWKATPPATRSNTEKILQIIRDAQVQARTAPVRDALDEASQRVREMS